MAAGWKSEAEHTLETISPYQKRFIAKGKREGRQEGRQEARQESLFDVLEARFDKVPDDIIEEINQIDDAGKLRTLIREASRVASLEEFHRLLSA
jgi:hypothetical protein